MSNGPCATGLHRACLTRRRGWVSFAELHTTSDAELARYDAVIHLRTPTVRDGYDHSNSMRIESAAEATAIDARILTAARSLLGATEE